MYYNKRQTCVPFHSEWFHRSFLNQSFHFTLLCDLHILNVFFVFIMVERNSFMKLHSVRRLSFTAVSRLHQLRQSWVFNSSDGNNLNFEVLCLAFENFSREGLSMYSTKTERSTVKLSYDLPTYSASCAKAGSYQCWHSYSPGSYSQNAFLF